MLLDSSPSVHMFFMRFPIDVVFLDRDRRVVAVKHCCARGGSRERGERRRPGVAGGTATAVGVEEGNVLILEDV